MDKRLRGSAGLLRGFLSISRLRDQPGPSKRGSVLLTDAFISFEVRIIKNQSVNINNFMSDKNQTGAEPQINPDNPTPDNNQEGAFDDFVGKEQPVNQIKAGVSDNGKEKQPAEKPDAEGKEPEGQSGVADDGKSENPEDNKKPEGDKLFWGKFKSADDAKHSYDEAQAKIIEQGKQLNELKTQNEKNEQFLSMLDKALVKKPELADQLKATLAEVVKASPNTPEDNDQDIDQLIDRKLEERESKARTKADIDSWIEKHPDFKEDTELGHRILDIIEKDGLPFNARTLQLAYDHATKDKQTKKAADEAIKKEQIKDLEREQASAVGGGESNAKGKVPQDNPFDDLVGEAINPNKVQV